jgi:hypothetical protein
VGLGVFARTLGRFGPVQMGGALAACQCGLTPAAFGNRAAGRLKRGSRFGPEAKADHSRELSRKSSASGLRTMDADVVVRQILM